MNPFKRIDAIASAFSTQLRDQRLVVIGDGPDLAKIEALAGPNVELVGRVSRDRLRDLLAEPRPSSTRPPRTSASRWPRRKRAAPR